MLPELLAILAISEMLVLTTAKLLLTWLLIAAIVVVADAADTVTTTTMISERTEGLDTTKNCSVDPLVSYRCTCRRFRDVLLLTAEALIVVLSLLRRLYRRRNWLLLPAPNVLGRYEIVRTMMTKMGLTQGAGAGAGAGAVDHLAPRQRRHD